MSSTTTSVPSLAGSARILPFTPRPRGSAPAPSPIDVLLRGARAHSRRDDWTTSIPDDLVASVLSAWQRRTA